MRRARRRLLTTVLAAGVAVPVAAPGAAASGLRTIPDLYLEGVSCPSASTCWAVGFAFSGAEKNHGVVVELVNGVPAHIHYVAVARALLRDISCTAPEACIAVGEGPAEQGEVMAIAGGVAGPLQSVGTPGWSLGEVSCGSATDCWAAGDNSGVLVQIEEGKPTTQDIEPGIVTFDDISCVAAGSCTALGAQSLTTERVVPIVAGQPSYGPILGPNLDNLSCVPGAPCELVGNSYPDRPLHALVATLEGTRQGTAHRAASLGGLLRVSCASSRVCEAVGYDTHDRTATVTIISGAARTPRLLPGGNVLDAVSCGSTAVCVAVGSADHGRRALVDVVKTGD